MPLGAGAAARPFEWGALVDYLMVPKVMLETGRYPDLPGTPHSLLAQAGRGQLGLGHGPGRGAGPRVLALAFPGLVF